MNVRDTRLAPAALKDCDLRIRVCILASLSLEAPVLTDKVQQQCCVNEKYQEEREYWVANTQKFRIVRIRFKLVVSG